MMATLAPSLGLRGSNSLNTYFLSKSLRQKPCRKSTDLSLAMELTLEGGMTCTGTCAQHLRSVVSEVKKHKAR